MLTTTGAARLLGMKESEIVSVDAYGDDTVVRLHDGSQAKVPADAEDAAGVEWSFGAPLVTDPDAARLRSQIDALHRRAFVPPAEWKAQLRGASAEGADIDVLISIIASWGPAEQTDTGDADEPAAEEGPADGEVPDGSADAVLAWVDGDPARAKRARKAEEGRDRPRSTVLGQLDKVIEAAGA